MNWRVELVLSVLNEPGAEDHLNIHPGIRSLLNFYLNDWRMTLESILRRAPRKIKLSGKGKERILLRL